MGSSNLAKTIESATLKIPASVIESATGVDAEASDAGPESNVQS